ncbi:MAG: hypothetical protein ACP5JG_02665 [Anaerolineae bacterium]
MDLFDVYPGLSGKESPTISGRSLRLIALAGFVFDGRHMYFELGAERYWGRLPNGRVAVGVGAPRVEPDGTFPPHHALVRYLRSAWRCSVDFLPAGYSYLLDESCQVEVLQQVDAHFPYLFIFTPPRLGGGDEVPDALVQAAYLLPVQAFQVDRAKVNLLRISREHLATFLASEDWEMAELLGHPWANVLSNNSLPENARMRPVLALRGLRHLLKADALPEALSS